jgi:SAM-dependent methyltransferase
MRLGRTQVSECRFLDVNPDNWDADVVADLSEPDSLPHERFDCVLLTRVLQGIDDLSTALSNADRTLSPGGVLLASMPAIGEIGSGVGTDRDLWRFTPAGVTALLPQGFRVEELEVASLGNMLTAIAFLLGLAAEELRDEELEYADPRFPLVVCVRARKRR